MHYFYNATPRRVQMKPLKKTNAPVWILFTLLFTFRILLYIASEVNFCPDSWEYISRDGFSWLHGSLDRYRLPVYPMLIDICQWMSADHYLLFVCAAQLLVSLLSIVILYQTLCRLIDKRWICCTVTFLYGTLSAVSGWDKTLLTESLSLSFSVFILFGIVSFIQDRKYRYIILTTGCLLFGCFLRAIFAVYAGLFVGFLVLITIFPEKSDDPAARSQQRKKYLKSTLIAMVPIIMVLFYAGSFYAQYGAFTLSDSGLGQHLYTVLGCEYYNDTSDTELQEIADTILHLPSSNTINKKLEGFLNDFYSDTDVSDAEKQQLAELLLSKAGATLDNAIESALDEYVFEEYHNDYDTSSFPGLYLARLYIMETYDRDRVVDFVNEAKRNNFLSYLILPCLNLVDEYTSYSSAKTSSFAQLFISFAGNLVFFFRITLLHSFLIGLWELFTFVMILIRKKKVTWVRCGLGVYLLATVAYSLFGTCGEFARTALTAIPFMFIAIGLYIHHFSDHVLQPHLQTVNAK